MLRTGETRSLERVLVGRNIWVYIKPDPERGFRNEFITGPHRVLSFQKWLPAGPVLDPDGKPTGRVREKHLVQLWADPPGITTLSVGSIRLKDPRKQAGARKAAVTRAAQDDEDD